MAASTLDRSLSTPVGMNTTAAELVWWNLIGIETPHDLDAVTYGAAGLTALKEWEYGARTDGDMRLLLPAAGWPDKTTADTLLRADVREDRTLTSTACYSEADVAHISPYPVGEEAQRLASYGAWHAGIRDEDMQSWFATLFDVRQREAAAAAAWLARAGTAATTVAEAAVAAAAAATVTVAPAKMTASTVVLRFLKEKLTSDGVKQFVAGGIAGGVSRTVVSPLERMKILFQVQGPEPAQYRGVTGTLMKIWREEGARGYMRGNGTNVIRIVPYSAVQFAAYEQFKRIFMEKGKSELDTPRRLLAGACAGVTSVAFTYPLDIVRTRLSVQTAMLEPANAASGVANRTGPGIWATMRIMYVEEGGLRALYRGLGPTMTGVAPYVALNFQAYEVLRKYFTPPGESAPTSINKLMCGAMAGTIAQTFTYPLDVLRRRMQVTGMKQVGYKYRNTWHAVREVIAKEGIVGLYKGMIPNYLKVAPAIGVSFWTYEMCKDMFGCR